MTKTTLTFCSPPVRKLFAYKNQNDESMDIIEASNLKEPINFIN